MQTLNNQSKQRTMSRIKAVLFVIAVILIIAFNARMYDLYRQQKADIENNNSNIQLQIQAITALKQQAGDLAQELKDQKSALVEQKDRNDQLESKIDAFNSKTEGIVAQAKEDTDRMNTIIDTLQASVAQNKSEIAAMKKSNKEWQTDFVSVMATLEKKSVELDAQLKATRADFIERVNKLDTQIKTFNKSVFVQDSAVKPTIIRKKLSDDDLDISNVKSDTYRSFLP